jgi:hypothetical protein
MLTPELKDKKYLLMYVREDKGNPRGVLLAIKEDNSDSIIIRP